MKAKEAREAITKAAKMCLFTAREAEEHTSEISRFIPFVPCAGSVVLYASGYWFSSTLTSWGTAKEDRLNAAQYTKDVWRAFSRAACALELLTQDHIRKMDTLRRQQDERRRNHDALTTLKLHAQRMGYDIVKMAR